MLSEDFGERGWGHHVVRNCRGFIRSVKKQMAEKNRVGGESWGVKGYERIRKGLERSGNLFRTLKEKKKKKSSKSGEKGSRKVDLVQKKGEETI